SLVDCRRQSAARVDRPGNVARERPGTCRPTEQAPKRGAGKAEQAGQGDPWKEQCARRPDCCIRGDELLFGLTNVRPADQEFGRKACRNERRTQRFEGGGPWNRSRVSPDKHRKRILLPGDGLPDGRELGERGFIFALDL